MGDGPKKVVLVAAMGMSPAVLTETVWALAHRENPTVPDEIAVLTTSSGRNGLKAVLMEGMPCVWERLKDALRREGIAHDGKLVFGETSIRVIPDADGNETDDLRTGEDNLLAANFMLGELRKYTESSDTVVLASIAGGRKTMSALLFSCMTLLGREDDKVYHVLIPPEYECGMEPPFFFPQKGVTHQILSRGQPTGKKVPGTEIGIELFEVPFVRMRGWYQEKFKTIPPSYRTLISRMRMVAPSATVYPEIEIDAWNGRVKVDGRDVPLSKTCFAALLLLADGCPAKNLHAKLLALHSAKGAAACDWLATFQESERFNEHSPVDAVYKTMSELRMKLKAIGFSSVESLVPKRGQSVTFPPARVKWCNRGKLADICGCLRSGFEQEGCDKVGVDESEQNRTAGLDRKRLPV
ncbi:MAG: TIGR02584 family CRISPR-associated protein [Kiritimatiellae bacterium]|nr:TIGR02584 family CRISPR-associated protein [Kiritimatiellia bacterium]